MTQRHVKEEFALARELARWTLLSSWVGLLAGLSSAGFLIFLDWATQVRTSIPILLFVLPVAGAAIGLAYERWGRGVSAGNDLLIEEIHEPRGPIPFRMVPMVLIATLATHLFGGSAGREGTAVQMGGALADFAARALRLSKRHRRIMLLTGISAGFGAVFGTPLAGCVFGLEVLTRGRLESEALVPCLVGSVVGDLVCRGCGVHHVAYSAATSFAPTDLPAVVAASVVFAMASVAFVELTHRIGKLGKDLRGGAWIRPVVGGCLVVALTLVVGNQDYNGLGLPLIFRSFRSLDLPLGAFALKILFTAVTLGSGFRGGEVTPLFCIGATLGNAFAHLTGGDPALYAALGFAAVFAGAANTPLACTIMGIELFGARLAVPLAIASAVAYGLSGPQGIYASQRPSNAANEPEAEP